MNSATTNAGTQPAQSAHENKLNEASGMELEDALLQLGLIDQNQLELVKIESVNTGQPIEEIVEKMNLTSSENLIRAWGLVFGMSYINLEGTSVPTEILNHIPEHVAKKYKIVAFGEKDGRLQIAASDPHDLQALEALEFIKQQNNYNVDVFIAGESSLSYVLDQYGTLKKEVGKILEEATSEEIGTDDVGEEEIEDEDQLNKVIKDAPISKVVSIIIKYAVQSRASDIHIEAEEDQVRVRYRIDGNLAQKISLPKHLLPAIVSRIKIMSNLKIDEQRLPQDGRFRSKINNKDIDFRVSTFPSVNGEKVVMRILDTSEGILTMEQLGVTGHSFEVLEKNITKPHGMILATGPTGSGKSTTLYSFIDRLNNEKVNIVTLEDPVEYFMTGVNQSQVKSEIGYTFASGIRTILRQDPDIVMVGEIRDFETAEMAIHAALTGHIVLSTLHTNDAAGAIPRLVDMKIATFLIVSAINVIFAQRLVRRICPDCGQKKSPSPEELEKIKNEINKMSDAERNKINFNGMKIMVAKGCDKCQGLGYRGRIAIFEVLPINESIKDLVLKGASSSDVTKKAIEEGMLTLRQDGILKVLNGITTLDEVWHATKE
jgi:type IV pilus assembly protein PilB